MTNEKVDIVASYVDTVPGKMIKLRGAMKFWNRYDGDTYSHISLSRDNKLDNMMSFARKEMGNPFCSGLIKEDIRTGMFSLNPKVSKIAVMELEVSQSQFKQISSAMNYYWETREHYNYNYLGLASMLFCGRGIAPENHFFCSQWVATVLQECGINLFEKDAKDIRPFDFYGQLKGNITYEGLVTEYPLYKNEDTKQLGDTNIKTCDVKTYRKLYSAVKAGKG